MHAHTRTLPIYPYGFNQMKVTFENIYAGEESYTEYDLQSLLSAKYQYWFQWRFGDV